MCSPVLAIGLAGASAVSSFSQQRSINRAERQRFNEAKKIARTNAIAQHEALIRRTSQERKAASDALNRIVDESQALLGRARASAAEGNVQGNTVNLLLDNFRRVELERTQLVRDNLGVVEDQIRQEHDAVVAAEQANALSATPRTPRASLLNTALGFGSQAALIGLQFGTGSVPSQGTSFSSGPPANSLIRVPGIPGGFVGPG